VLLWLLLCLAGCKGYDEFSFRKMNFEVFQEPDDPLGVLASSNDGNVRARAIRCLGPNRGTKEQQTAALAKLQECATSDPQLLCRIAAIGMLREYRDPQAVKALEDAYYRAGSFSLEQAHNIRCQTLTAIGETGNEAGVELLARVLREPATEGPNVDRQQKIDERIAAARALANFKTQAATTVLVETLRNERDVALRSRVQESLSQITGKDIPADAVAWEGYFADPSNSKAPDRTTATRFGERVLDVTGLR
jgi:hypothetical protein